MFLLYISFIIISFYLFYYFFTFCFSFVCSTFMIPCITPLPHHGRIFPDHPPLSRQSIFPFKLASSSTTNFSMPLFNPCNQQFMASSLPISSRSSSPRSSSSSLSSSFLSLFPFFFLFFFFLSSVHPFSFSTHPSPSPPLQLTHSQALTLQFQSPAIRRPPNQAANPKFTINHHSNHHSISVVDLKYPIRHRPRSQP